MAGTVRTKAYQDLLAELIKVRKGAGLSQAELAQKIGKPASFIGKYELGERRLDVVELMVILGSLEMSFDQFWAQANITLPEYL